MRLEGSVVVDRPIDEVWPFLSDPFHVPRYGKAALGLRRTSPGPIGLGTTYQGRVAILGVEIRVSAVVTEWDPPHSVTFSGRGTAFRSGSIRVTLEATPDGTKAVRVAEIEPRGIWKLLLPIALPFLKRGVKSSDRNIKRLLEAGRG